MGDDLVYLDNAATSFPKPAGALREALEAYLRGGVSPSRGSYDLAKEARQIVDATRARLATLFGAPDPARVVFTGNASDALNTALQGMLRRGDHVVSTRLEHNSVLRPLHHLHVKGTIEYDLVRFDSQGFVDPDEVARTIRSQTRLVVVTHASNVLGTVQPIEEIGRICRARGVALVVDAAQTAGAVPIDMQAWQAAAIAFTGHKSLLGPTGIGGLVVAPDAEIEPTRFGGTGVDSESLAHTPTFPHRLECGTLNVFGIMGLGAGLDFIEHAGMTHLYEREMQLLARLRDGLCQIEGVKLYCPDVTSRRVALLTVNIGGMDPEDAGSILDADFGIAVRIGLHCAPLVHEDLGTSPRGAVRFSLGPYNSEADIERALAAVTAIAGMGR